MIRLAIIFFAIALVAAMFGFGGVAGASYSVGKGILFLVVVAVALAALFGSRLLARS